jgi:hypothetical protein
LWRANEPRAKSARHLAAGKAATGRAASGRWRDTLCPHLLSRLHRAVPSDWAGPPWGIRGFKRSKRDGYRAQAAWPQLANHCRKACPTAPIIAVLDCPPSIHARSGPRSTS